MRKNPRLALVAVAFALLVFGCSDDNSNPSGSGDDATTLHIVDVAEIIRAATPPVYEAPSSAPAIDSFEVWTQGDWPLLEMVFGRDEPQTLDQNLYEFEFFLDAIKDIMLLDDSGAVITGTYVDSVVREEQGQDVTYHGVFVVSLLTEPTVIPAAHQGILGASHEMDCLVDITIDEIPDGRVKLAFTLDSTEQSMVVYVSDMDNDPGRTHASVVYSTLNLLDSTFVFKGVLYAIEQYGTFGTAYVVSSMSAGEFGYRASWIYDGTEPSDTAARSSIIGGGNKDVEFALSFRMWYPFDAPEPDPDWAFDQVFGPNYTEGTGLVTSFSDYLNDSLIIPLEYVPGTIVADPWAL